MIKSLPILFLAPFLLSACSSTPHKAHLTWDEYLKLPTDPLSLAAGEYKNKAYLPKGDSMLLWTILTDQPSDLNDTVRLTITGKNTLQAERLIGKDPVSTKTFRFTPKDTYLRLKNQSRWHMEAFPLIWGNERLELSLGFTKDAVHLYIRSSGAGLILIMPAAGGGGPGGVSSHKRRIR